MRGKNPTIYDSELAVRFELESVRTEIFGDGTTHEVTSSSDGARRDDGPALP